MNELDLIRGRFNQTFRIDYPFGTSLTHRAWHGPSLLRALDGVGLEQAKTRQINGRHNIWEIVNHCTYWMMEVDRALQGEDIFDVETIEDWPEIDASIEAWESDLNELVNTFERLDQRISKLVVNDLERKLDATWGETYFNFTFRKMLHGISDHNVYHAGQISLLKTIV